MENKTIISILMSTFLISTMLSTYFVSPTKAEVERYFEENNCICCSGEPWGEVYRLRRETGMLWGQIFKIPRWWLLPKFILYTTTPFKYYNDINHDEDEFHTYTWVDTREGRFVYNAITGEYVKEIDDKEDPDMKYYLESNEQIEELLKNLSEENNNI
jgi:hypothetical protein